MIKPRSELKGFFKKNKIPTQANFEDLIDSVLSLNDDGVAKTANDPLTIQAVGTEESVLRFSRVDTAGSKPTWTIKQKPEGAATSGLAFQDAAGSVSLFLESGTGQVGIGSVTPEAKLQIISQNQNPGGGTLILGPTNQSNLRLGYDEGYSWIQSHGSKPLAINPIGNNVGIGTTTPARRLEINNALKLTNSGSDGNDGVIGTGTFGPGLNLVGIRTDNTYRKIALWGEITQRQNDGINTWGGTNSFAGNLKLTGGALTPSPGNDQTNGIMWPQDAYGGAGDAAWIRYHNARGGERGTLELGISNDWDDHIVLNPSGNVGIGTLNPTAKLDVNGPVMQQLAVINCGGRGDWGAANHPIMGYFQSALNGKPVGTYVKAIQDHPAWRGHYWQGWVDADGRIRVIHNYYNTSTVM